jgi:hypothetical protein
VLITVSAAPVDGVLPPPQAASKTVLAVAHDSAMNRGRWRNAFDIKILSGNVVLSLLILRKIRKVHAVEQCFAEIVHLKKNRN